ncbi:MAG: nicotinate phosphoribosyltransferase [Clostridia bacterium]|nr:nicotinate phosphoribosyltransferase [Clostridia bacterium]
MDSRNLTLLCDFYELTMANGYFKTKKRDTVAYFDVFFRNVPDEGGFAIAAGLEQIIDYVKNLHFSESDIEFLRDQNCFSEEFLEYLKDFRFTGDIYAVPEGTPIFPREPVITVKAPVMEAQFIETYILTVFNHQSLIATKANRISRAADGRAVSEFGVRRAQGADAAFLGARAAYIGGVNSTSCTLTAKDFSVPVSGTMAHSWVQMFDSEYEAFETYCRLYPNNATLLVDTYNVIKSGIPNAIKAFKACGIENCGIRIDSGDIAYLTKKARKMLDEAGMTKCKIVVSNSLDEKIIVDIIRQGAQIDAFGVGERLITAKSHPVFGGVYKLSAIEENGKIVPKIKISENHEKITNPHFKKLYRLFRKSTGRAIADYISLYDEQLDDTKPLELFDPVYTWKRQTVDDYYAVELLKPIFINGELVYKAPEIKEIREYCKNQVETLWDEVLRFENPHRYYVDLSQKLWDLKNELLANGGKLKG